jgi:hypothetical protein
MMGVVGVWSRLSAIWIVNSNNEPLLKNAGQLTFRAV